MILYVYNTIYILYSYYIVYLDIIIYWYNELTSLFPTNIWTRSRRIVHPYKRIVAKECSEITGRASVFYMILPAQVLMFKQKKGGDSKNRIISDPQICDMPSSLSSAVLKTQPRVFASENQSSDFKPSFGATFWGHLLIFQHSCWWGHQCLFEPPSLLVNSQIRVG